MKLSLETIAAFLKEELTSQEMADIETYLRSNPLEAQRVMEVADALEEGRTMSDLKEQERLVSKSITDLAQPASSTIKYYGIAAAIILLLAAGLWLFIPSQMNRDDLYMAHFEPYENVISARGDGETTWRELMILYDKGAYNKFLQSSEKLSDTEKSNNLYALYRGIAFMELDQFDSALASLEPIKAQKDQYLQEHAYWYGGLCLIKSNMDVKAIVYFSWLEGHSSYYASRASELSAILKKK